MTQKETESNWCSIALAGIEAYSRSCNTHIYIGVHNIILSSKTSFSHNCLNNGVILELCKNLLFLDFQCPKVQINMLFICSIIWETTMFVMSLEWMKYLICSMFSHMLIRFQCWLDLHRLQTLLFWHAVKT